MRVDSCRNCGQMLDAVKLCQVCTQPIQLKCNSCPKYVDDPIHSLCEIKCLTCWF